MAQTGRPAPFRLGAPAYLAALAGWVAAAVLVLASADELTRLALSGTAPVAAAHAIGVVFFPFAVAAAVWQLLPVMLRNDPPLPGLRWLVLALLAAGVPLAVSVAWERQLAARASAALLAAGLVLLLSELVSLIRGAPRGRRLVVSRPAVALAGAHAAAAFALGVVLVEAGPEPLGVPYERLLLVHLSLALVGWLTVLIAAVGRTLVPMLGLAATAPPRSAPWAELAVVAGLWVLVAGIAASVDALLVAGVVAILAGLSAPGRLFLRVARSGTIGAREGPVAHVAVGLLFLFEAAALVLAAAATDVVSGRRAAVAAVLLVGIGWAVGVIVGHLGKLISLSGWGSWPPGPRPKQAELYPRHGWQAEVILFALGVELLGAGVVADTTALTRVGGALLVAAAIVALACAVETVRRVAVAR